MPNPTVDQRLAQVAEHIDRLRDELNNLEALIGALGLDRDMALRIGRHTVAVRAEADWVVEVVENMMAAPITPEQEVAGFVESVCDEQTAFSTDEQYFAWVLRLGETLSPSARAILYERLREHSSGRL